MKKLLIPLILVFALLSGGCRSLDGSTVTEPETFPETPAETIPETAAPEPEPSSVSLVMVGDVLLHEKVADSGKMADGSYNYDHLFANIKDEVSSADLALVNQEVILGGRELGLSGYPCFNGAFEVGDALVKTGFNVVLHATNHALDKGKAGLLSCINFWRGTYPDTAVLGIYDSEASSKEIYVYEKDGIRLAILNYTYGTNGIALPGDMPYCVSLLSDARIRDDIARAKEISDFVVVAPHWGTEYIHTVDSNQKHWTQLFFECGADLVIGTHPHVVEPIEMISDETHSMLVYYSLGNFVNSTAQTGAGIADRMLGAMATVTVTKTEEDAEITDWGVIPLVSHVKSGSGLLTTYKLSDYTEALASENEIVASDSAFSLEYCKTICRNVFGELYTG